MANGNAKLALSASRDIPFNKLVLSQSNVRRHGTIASNRPEKTGVSIEELAEDIFRRTLLQSLSVRAIVNSEGEETGMFEVPAGGRRFRALELLVKQKRMAKTQPVPCVVRTGGIAEEDSLAENVQRQALHPLDQFRAFQALKDKGLSDEDIAARFFVPVNVVRQRLRLAAVSPKLLELYAEDGMTLEQLMAFTITNDHKRQEQVWASLERSYSKEPYAIRRLLSEKAVRAGDKRAQFVGTEAYEAAGGTITRDLFAEDNGGWLQDPALLDRLVEAKLKAEVSKLEAEGWKWITPAVELPYGHTAGLRRLNGTTAELTNEERLARDALRSEYEALEAEHAGPDDLPEAVDARLGEIETALAAFDNRPVQFDPVEVAMAGAFISVGADGGLLIERGYVRPEHEIPKTGASGADGDDPHASQGGEPDAVRGTADTAAPDDDANSNGADEDEGLRPLSDRLLIELTAHRTLALRDAMAQRFDAAFIGVLHVLCLDAFYHARNASCLEISAKSASFSVQAPGLKDSVSAKAIEARHETWRAALPSRADDLWAALVGFDRDSREDLFAHCASLSVNAVHEPWNRANARQTHADQLARAIDLDMSAAGWRATEESYLGRVSKARILEAVREGKDEKSAQLIGHLKKGDMAREAERLLAGSNWLPEPLRTPDVEVEPSSAEGGAAELPAFLQGDDESGADPADEDEAAPASPTLQAAE